MNVDCCAASCRDGVSCGCLKPSGWCQFGDVMNRCLRTAYLLAWLELVRHTLFIRVLMILARVTDRDYNCYELHFLYSTRP
jgi:hypothetical protein